MRIFYSIIFCVYLLVLSCSKESIDTSSQYKLKFSSDTLIFDTVFQTLGSATRSFKIYNPTQSTFIISKAYLAGGTNSPFRFNLDGLPHTQATDIRILPQDSLWLFADVTVDPNPNNPILVQDSIIIETNGGKQTIILRAIGQNAYFHYGEIISSSTIFSNDKPHVIIEKKTSSGTIPGIVISPNTILTIQEGTQLHFSSGAGILSLGTIKSMGTSSQPIKMRGLRLEKNYIHAAGQWLGILFERNSKDNLIEYTTIDESAFGIWLGYQTTTDFNAMKNNLNRPELSLKNSTISNAYYWGIRSINGDLQAENSQIYTSTDYLIQLFLGGITQFRNCTIFNIQAKDKKSNFILSNKIYDEVSKQTYTNKIENTTIFENCIFHSNTDESIIIEIDETINSNLDFQFKNCNYNSASNLNTSSFISCQMNQNPNFESTTIDKENLKLKSNSPCIDRGFDNGLSIDITGSSRPKGSGIDIGAFEF